MKWTMKVKKLFVAFMLCEIKTKQTTKQKKLSDVFSLVTGKGKKKTTWKMQD